MVGQLKFRNVFIMFIDESDQNRYEEVSWENNKKYFIYIYWQICNVCHLY